MAAALGVLVTLALPYAVVAENSAVGVYYGTGALNALLVGLFAGVAFVVFAAGRYERSAPDLVAGVALVLGLFMLVVTILWIATLPSGFVGQLTSETLLSYHRWALLAVVALVPVSAGWFTWSLGII
jgi:hypothetical protein